jgi:hypothetical protein
MFVQVMLVQRHNRLDVNDNFIRSPLTARTGVSPGRFRVLFRVSLNSRRMMNQIVSGSVAFMTVQTAGRSYLIATLPL